MKHQQLRANLILLTTAAIWGLAFTAQKVAAGQMGAFTYTGIRFALGSLTVLPFYLVRRSRMKKEDGLHEGGNLLESLMAGISSGIILFIAVSLQQLGLVETEAGKAAFITALYIIFVPLFGIFLKQKVKINGWIGAVLALTGLYLLSVTGSMTISRGDVYVLLCACFWAVHILMIDRFSSRIEAVKFSLIQFVTCSVLSLVVATVFETIEMAALIEGAVPILYGGIFSVGIAYTLQVIGQKNAKPSHAAIILSMETVFGSLGGIVFLHENLGTRGYIGCLLMLAGMLVSQLKYESKVRKSDTLQGVCKRV